MSKRRCLKAKESSNLPCSFWFNHSKDRAHVLEPYILVSGKAFPFALNILWNLYTVSHLDNERYMLGKCKYHFYSLFLCHMSAAKISPINTQSKNQHISNVPVVKQLTVIDKSRRYQSQQRLYIWWKCAIQDFHCYMGHIFSSEDCIFNTYQTVNESFVMSPICCWVNL